MIKKGIILAGGKGTRMSPLTKAVNKQLLPIYDKPLIFYPLSILMLSKIKDILIIVNKGQLDQYKKLIPNGNNLGINITYKEQDKPSGLPDAFILGEKFIGSDSVSLILGDNFFYGQSLSDTLKRCTNLKSGAKVLLYKVNNPELFGVAKIDKKNQKIKILKEKPKKFISDQAVTGLYFFDNNVVHYAKSLKPSKRNELEIIDLLNKYKIKKKLSAEFLGRGGAWLDTGSIEDYYKTSAFVQAIENRQGLKIACLEEIALLNKWITKSQVMKQVKFYGNCEYSNYLKKIIKKVSNILLTGATGFIGSNILKKIRLDNKVFIIQRGLSKKKIKKTKNIKIITFEDYNTLSRKLKKINVDIVIHCATHYKKEHLQIYQ